MSLLGHYCTILPAHLVPTKEKEQTVTRVEIINENGIAFVDTKSTYTLSFQDNNQTLKLFKIPQAKKPATKYLKEIRCS